MDNPYWKTEGQTHEIDIESIRGLCFELCSVIEASHSLGASLAAEEPEDRTWPTATPMFLLHREMAEKQTLKLLLQIALMVRTFDDIMKDSDDAEAYSAHVKKTDGDDSLGWLEGEEKFGLREACNKVIHATEIRPLYDRAERSLAIGEPEPTEEAEDIWYLTGEVELKGSFKGKAWEATLYAQDFLETILERVHFEPPEPMHWLSLSERFNNLSR